MKTLLRPLLVLLTLAAACPLAHALISRHGQEAVRCGGWSDALAALVNDASRMSGEIGPVGPAGRFHYAGGAAVLNEFLARYAKLPQKAHVLYLMPQSSPAPSSDRAPEGYDFDLSITYDGEGYVHLYTVGRIKLEDLALPPGLTVEMLPSAGLAIAPDAKAAALAEQKRVEDFVKAHHLK